MSEKKTHPKLKQAKVNLYPKQHEILIERAKENGTNISEYIRQKLDLNLDKNDTRKKYKEHEKVTYKKADPQLIYQLAKIGTNLNQIAKQLNQKKDVSTIEILESLISIEKKIKEIK